MPALRSIGALVAALACSRVALAADFRSTTTTSPLDHNDELLGGASALQLTEARTDAGTLGDTLQRAPGARVRSSGAPGAPEWLSIRASAPWQVGVYLDGVPLHGADTAAFDLSLLPAPLLAEVVVYRASLPVALGPPLPGGAIELRTRFEPDDGEQITVGGGSFASRRATASIQRRRGNVDWLLGAHYVGTSGRFSYFDNNGTALDASDDGTSVRRNAWLDRGALLGRMRARVARWRVTGLALLDGGREGLPGQVGAEALEAQLGRAGVRLASTADRRLEAGRLRLLGFAAWTRAELKDPEGEMGLAADRRIERGLRAGLSLQPRWEPSDRVTAAGVLDVSVEDIGVTDALTQPGLSGALRLSSGVGAEAVWSPVPRALRLRTAARLDVAHDAIRGEPAVRSETAGGIDVLPNGSAGSSWTPLRTATTTVALRAEASTAGRTPSFVERYGDRGAFVGNPALRPERRVGGELGGSVQIAPSSWRLVLDGAGFVRRTVEQIVWVETGVGVASPRNLERVDAWGTEASVGFGWESYVAVDFAHTWIHARDVSGAGAPAEVPWQPAHWLDARVRGRLFPVELELGLDAMSGFALDREGLRRVPSRTLLHGAAAVELPAVTGLRLGARVDNLLNLRAQEVLVRDGGRSVPVPRAIADFTAMPLPGRAVWVTLSWHRTATE